MKRTRFTDEQIVGILHEAAAGAGTVREVCRRHGITETTFYRWRAKYGGMQKAEIRRLKQLEDENRRLKKLVADLSLDVAMLKDVAGRSW
jgi:putative transposase